MLGLRTCEGILFCLAQSPNTFVVANRATIYSTSPPAAHVPTLAVFVGVREKKKKTLTGRRETQAEAEDDVLWQRLHVDRVLADGHQHVGSHHHRLLVSGRFLRVTYVHYLHLQPRH